MEVMVQPSPLAKSLEGPDNANIETQRRPEIFLSSPTCILHCVGSIPSMAGRHRPTNIRVHTWEHGQEYQGITLESIDVPVFCQCM